MWTLVARMDRALRAASIPIESVSIGTSADRTSWKVQPATLQAAAQPVIDGFNNSDPAVADADVTADAALSAADKDLIATLAVVAQQTDANWGTKTLPQKVATVQALVTSWKAMRAFVEKNL